MVLLLMLFVIATMDTPVTAGKIEGAVTGQGNNRYAYFLIPEGCNYVVVDLENNTVLFDIK